MWRICFTIPAGSPTISGDRQICINIPLLIDPIWKVRGPGPEPWLVLNEKPLELAQDLQILATMTVLSQELSPELRRTFTGAIEQGFSSLKRQLPAGAELNFHEGAETGEASLYGSDSNLLPG